MPYIRDFLTIIAKSPFGPLREHSEKVREAVILTDELVDAFCENDREKVEELTEKISSIEEEADAIKRGIKDHIPKTTFLPVDRGDILTWLDSQDDVANAAEDAAKLMTIITAERLPEPFKDSLRSLTKKSIEAVNTLNNLNIEIEKELESILRRRDSKIYDMILEINRKEGEADEIEKKALKNLLDSKDELDPIIVIYTNKIAEQIGEIANKAEETAERIRTVISRKK
ncbi:MAG: TIGR00153 family protein [Candidatus Hydrothermarchaeota archaeon]